MPLRRSTSLGGLVGRLLIVTERCSRMGPAKPQPPGSCRCADFSSAQAAKRRTTNQKGAAFDLFLFSGNAGGAICTAAAPYNETTMPCSTSPATTAAQQPHCHCRCTRTDDCRTSCSTQRRLFFASLPFTSQMPATARPNAHTAHTAHTAVICSRNSAIHHPLCLSICHSHCLGGTTGHSSGPRHNSRHVARQAITPHRKHWIIHRHPQHAHDLGCVCLDASVHRIIPHKPHALLRRTPAPLHL